MNLALNCWFSQCYNSRILTAKLSPYYFTYLLFNLRFRREQQQVSIADGKVVLQQVRWEMRLASDNSWAWCHLKHLLWRSWWIVLSTLEQRMATAEHDVIWSIWSGDHGELSWAHLNREWQFHTKSRELINAFLVCPPDWAQCPLVNAICRCLVAGQLYLSCGFSLAGCRWFQVFTDI